jgi:hypothetical protein
MIQPSLAFGAGTGAAEFSAEPFLEGFGTGVADEVDDGVAEAVVFWVTEFCGDASPEGPFVEWRWRVSGRGGVDDDMGVAGGSAIASWQKDGVHHWAPTRNLVS